MDRKVSWGRPTGDEWERSYASKCGRYTIRRRRFSSARNGHFASIGYVVTLPSGKTATHDLLVDAKDEAEFDNDPNWEPS